MVMMLYSSHTATSWCGVSGRLGLGGRLAAGGSAPHAMVPYHHPAQAGTIVLFVVGGMGYNEAAQVQSVLTQCAGTGKRIVLMSNAALCAEELLCRLFGARQQSS
jgi:hypothetical protein